MAATDDDRGSLSPFLSSPNRPPSDSPRLSSTSSICLRSCPGLCSGGGSSPFPIPHSKSRRPRGWAGGAALRRAALLLRAARARRRTRRRARAGGGARGGAAAAGGRRCGGGLRGRAARRRAAAMWRRRGACGGRGHGRLKIGFGGRGEGGPVGPF